MLYEQSTDIQISIVLPLKALSLSYFNVVSSVSYGGLHILNVCPRKIIFIAINRVFPVSLT
jgi:hypothetical protein